MNRAIFPDWVPPRFYLDDRDPGNGRSYYAQIDDIEHYLIASSDQTQPGRYVEWVEDVGSGTGRTSCGVSAEQSLTFRLAVRSFQWVIVPWFHFAVAAVFACLALALGRAGLRSSTHEGGSHLDYPGILVLSIGAIAFSLSGIVAFKIRRMMSEGK